ncbi:unnamed protein product [Chilo suppressalis]|uniref:Sm domain-containing protein n=1 Tax=Chilo suppressalis TaxID=168631 RepID=A0ABN8B8K4_CHISP|nr:hypothetical protein evm_010583 [Chilo suppressalis]CAH0405958.1 unnamed protein product [Chilo suppressalis]
MTRLSTNTLIKIAAWGGIIVSTTGFYLQTVLIDRVRNFDYYKAALKTLRSHAGAVYYLGEPIKDKRFSISDSENNFSDGQTARFRVPVTGTKDKGQLKEGIKSFKMFVGTAKEKFYYHNTLLCLVKALQNQSTLVDLRNDSYVCGVISTVDGFMNISMTNVVYCDQQGNEYTFENLFIHARNIRYVHVPQSASIITTIRNELTQTKQKVPKTSVEKSRKAKKALKLHMETVASI